MPVLEMKEVPGKLNEIANHYGVKNQSIVCIEELSEFQKELCKMLRGEGDLDKLIEELADVEIMLFQVKSLYDIDEVKVEAYQLVKTQRQLARIKEE